MYIQSCDINSIEGMLQGHVEQADVLIILGDFTGLSQSEGIRMSCMLLMIAIYNRKTCCSVWVLG